MGEVSTIGLDIAKSVFQVHGVDVDGAVVIRKRVSICHLLLSIRCNVCTRLEPQLPKTRCLPQAQDGSPSFKLTRVLVHE